MVSSLDEEEVHGTKGLACCAPPKAESAVSCGQTIIVVSLSGPETEPEPERELKAELESVKEPGLQPEPEFETQPEPEPEPEPELEPEIFMKEFLETSLEDRPADANIRYHQGALDNGSAVDP